MNVSRSKKIQLFISAIAALGALAGGLLYLDQKKDSKLKREVTMLDKEIKQLQLLELKNKTHT